MFAFGIYKNIFLSDIRTRYRTWYSSNPRRKRANTENVKCETKENTARW